MLRVINLSVSIQDQNILKSCSVDFQVGKVHVVMGPNGSGKSSLAATIMGHPNYQVQSGHVVLNGQAIENISVTQRSALGLFLGVQNPLEIQGLRVEHFLKEIVALKHGKPCLLQELHAMVIPLLDLIGLPQSILQRCVNVGFSGGEKKRFELLQMLLLEPKVAILDELDSGVDIDGLKHLGRGLQWYRGQHKDATIILITHYRHILEYIKPDFVHIMTDGSVVATGDHQLLNSIEKHGYGQYAKGS